MAFHREGGLWKIFGNKVCKKFRPGPEVDLVNGGDKCIFEGAEGLRMEVFGKFKFSFVTAENAVGLVWRGTCQLLLIRGSKF